MDVSVILCTRNRADQLATTLKSLGAMAVPPNLRWELIVVDNNSSDDTRRVAQECAATSALAVRYLFEGRQGLSHARNTGLAHAQGELVLFTDDDVAVANDWLAQMVDVFRRTSCDAAVGKTELAPGVLRPWMNDYFRGVLAAMDFELGGPLELVGVNMGFRRSVLQRVREFDPELGSGALGLGEETLFGWQLMEAGYTIAYARHAVVVHHPDVSRLRRSEWLSVAAKTGARNAYLEYHWEHSDLRAARLKWLWFWTKLRVRRILQPPPPLASEGCPRWEMSYVAQLERCRRFCVETNRPRNYARRGLRKRVRSQPRPVAL